MADKKCLNCGKMIQGWYKLCPFCHAETEETKSEATSYYACPHCRQRIDSSDTLCPHCNKDIGDGIIVLSCDGQEQHPTKTIINKTPDKYQSDALFEYVRRIEDHAHKIKLCLYFFVILTVIALVVYFISTLVSCYAACKVAEELESVYSFFLFV